MIRAQSISKAEKQDAGRIAALVNSAYRGESSQQGWTTEADLLAGRRTETKEILSLISSDDSMFLLCKAEAELIGSVHLQKQGELVCFGMLAVSPSLQGKGIGKQLLLAAELTAQQTWAVSKSAMSVISCRSELIAFYERRGYRRTGVSKAFPVNPELWMPKVTDLRLEILEKVLSANRKL
ncbi:MAG: GNAT family N-acetyltransferase [Methylobacter sp.]|uniref:GNAT family N-acetyltransferase n=1 Tax=Methylobacter sp. TaxID=2051955 RepID=UPI002731E782|nr:GNAT family N-acetyltransferase [Methylobacter sp.]MDP1663988.1 GNAT family N-acetyltransferase [Methylobacter sp.]